MADGVFGICKHSVTKIPVKRNICRLSFCLLTKGMACHDALAIIAAPFELEACKIGIKLCQNLMHGS